MQHIAAFEIHAMPEICKLLKYSAPRLTFLVVPNRCYLTTTMSKAMEFENTLSFAVDS